jgi:O-antigen/teichoic acid export membrane protein
MLMLMNGALALAQFLAAPLVAAYFRQPQVADILRVQSVIYLTVPFSALSYAILSRKMDFRRPAQVRLVGAIVGAATALVMASSGFGVWTLVAAPIAMYVTEAAGMMIAARAPWRPSFRFAGAGHIAGFGGMMTMTQLFWFIQSQADVMIAGRMLAPHWLGVYTTALFLAQLLAAKFVPPINEVAFAAYSRQQQHGPASVLATIRLVLLIALPAYAGMAAVAPPLVAVVLGEQWHETAPILPILALAMGLMTLQILFSPATNALGKPKIAMQIAMMGAVVMPTAFWIGSDYGVPGFAWGWAGGMAVLTLLTVVYSARVLGLSLRALSEAISPIIFAAVMMGASVYLVRTMLPPLADLVQLLLLVPLGVALYGAVLFAIAPERLIEALRFARNRGDEAESAPAA